MATPRIYLDYAAAAPELPKVRRAGTRAAAFFGNPSSIHRDGLRSAALLQDARKEIAAILGSQGDEIVFTGSGTESDNLAILGIFRHARRSKAFEGKNIHIVTTAIEHPAVLEACRALESEGGAVTYLPGDETGRIDLKEFRAALRPETVLVSIAYANNEIGTVQPIREIAKEIRHYKRSQNETGQAKTEYPLFHTDACQAAQYLDLSVARLGVDLLSLNGTKLGGPRGIGLLYVRRGTPIDPIVYGGGQEGALRSGTENVPGAVGLAAALTEAARIQEKESDRLRTLRSRFISEIKNHFPEARMNGSVNDRLPNNVHVSFPNIASELLVLELDAKGISASAGSACSSAKESGSAVLEAVYGAGDGDAWGSVRFSMGRNTTKRDVSAAIKALVLILEKYKPWQQNRA